MEFFCSLVGYWPVDGKESVAVEDLGMHYFVMYFEILVWVMSKVHGCYMEVFVMNSSIIAIEIFLCSSIYQFCLKYAANKYLACCGSNQKLDRTKHVIAKILRTKK